MNERQMISFNLAEDKARFQLWWFPKSSRDRAAATQ